MMSSLCASAASGYPRKEERALVYKMRCVNHYGNLFIYIYIYMTFFLL